MFYFHILLFLLLKCLFKKILLNLPINCYLLLNKKYTYIKYCLQIIKHFLILPNIYESIDRIIDMNRFAKIQETASVQEKHSNNKLCL